MPCPWLLIFLESFTFSLSFTSVPFPSSPQATWASLALWELLATWFFYPQVFQLFPIQVFITIFNPFKKAPVFIIFIKPPIIILCAQNLNFTPFPLFLISTLTFQKSLLMVFIILSSSLDLLVQTWAILELLAPWLLLLDFWVLLNPQPQTFLVILRSLKLWALQLLSYFLRLLF